MSPCPKRAPIASLLKYTSHEQTQTKADITPQRAISTGGHASYASMRKSLGTHILQYMGGASTARPRSLGRSAAMPLKRHHATEAPPCHRSAAMPLKKALPRHPCRPRRSPEQRDQPALESMLRHVPDSAHRRTSGAGRSRSRRDRVATLSAEKQQIYYNYKAGLAGLPQLQAASSEDEDGGFGERG